MEAMSKKYKDQPNTAMERGIFWIEYVLRHKSAENLVSPARDMPFYKTSNLDILLVSAIGLFCIFKFTMLTLTIILFAFGYGRNTRKTKTE
ncbi:hypothetical protein ILUMI_14536 [Ignelater luminosus]|uniref:Glucuronosyltransferase n=1 Tax=Ignelater luminosus TaxID=2038154 RepID=A0A8K0CWD8_IGNLU|nr:hypothetical protein ILUMI_14536 [Ignelater luminosus]